MNKDQVKQAASIIDSVYYALNQTNVLNIQIKIRVIAKITSRLKVPLIEAKHLFKFALDNKIPKVWYALQERTEIIDSEEKLIHEAIRHISPDCIKAIMLERERKQLEIEKSIKLLEID
ncbi:hypothetical protein ABEX29_18990 [Brevibacillus porteri]|uniref:hypothetical protein n=1 Tax=Brevibacillus porteri TaxID=2126350 RepID=UPI00037D1D5B|nr:hypothetical protein A616_11415 [Brevibacillus brevis X23]